MKNGSNIIQRKPKYAFLYLVLSSDLINSINNEKYFIFTKNLFVNYISKLCNSQYYTNNFSISNNSFSGIGNSFPSFIVFARSIYSL